jgi:hypothetical protein
MKKLAIFAVLFLVLAIGLFAADVETLSVSGSVGMSFGDDELGDGVGPGFSSSKSGAFASISVGNSNDKVEAGVTVSLVPSIAFTEATENDDLGVGNGYDLIGDMIDWYDTVLAGTTGAVTGVVFPVIDFNGIEDSVEASTGLDFIIYGSPTEGWDVYDSGDQDLATDADTDHASQLYSAVRDAILAEIQGVSSLYDYSSSDYVDASWTDTEATLAYYEMELYDGFYNYVYGADSDDAWAASTPVSGAYLRLNAIGGVIDIEFEVNGKSVGVGSMVTSANASGDANLGLTIGLDEAVVPGLTASVLINEASPAADDDDDYATFEEEGDRDADISGAVIGTELNVGYTADLGGMSIGAMLEFGVMDFSDFGNSIVIGLTPTFAMPDVAGLNAKVEFNLLTGTELGMGLGANVGASIMGISPSVSFYYKNDAYGGDDSYTSYFDGSTASVDELATEDDVSSDSVTQTSLMAEFNSTDDAAATALAADLAVDLSGLMGMKLVTVGLGADFFLATPGSFGMDGSLGLDFSEVLGQPLTVSFAMGQYRDNDLTWAGTIGYTYAELFNASFTIEQTEAEVVGYSLGGTVSF